MTRFANRSPTSPYRVETSTDDAPLVDPTTGVGLVQGTRIRLSGLRLKRRLNSDRFRESMSRRFALNEHEMKVFINGEPLARFEIDVDVRYPPAQLPPNATRDGDWAVETLGDGREVRWWIGFTAKPIKDEAQQGISVIVRGKLAQRPFMFEAGGGTTGQLGQEYSLAKSSPTGLTTRTPTLRTTRTTSSPIETSFSSRTRTSRPSWIGGGAV